MPVLERAGFWDSIALFVTAYPITLAIEFLANGDVANGDFVGPTVVATGWVMFAHWPRASRGHRTLAVMCMTGAILAIVIAQAVAPEHWYDRAGASAAAAAAMLALFGRLTKMPRYAAPAPDPSAMPARPARVWTEPERRALLGTAGVQTFRNRPLRWFLLGLALTLVIVGPWLAIYGSRDLGWRGITAGVAISIWAVWCGVRAMRVELILDPAVITVRNLTRTRRVRWDRVEAVCRRGPAMTLRLDDGRIVEISELVSPVFRRGGAFEAILTLLGPAEGEADA